MKFTIHPLTPDLWPALEDLFGDSDVCSRCWCMYWRIGAAYRRKPGKMNKATFREIVERGPPPGLIAFDGDVAVGWCQLTPRDQVPELDRTWRLKRVDDLPMWSITCFYVRKGYRKRALRLRSSPQPWTPQSAQERPRWKPTLWMRICRRAVRILVMFQPSSALDLRWLLVIRRLARLCATI